MLRPQLSRISFAPPRPGAEPSARISPFASVTVSGTIYFVSRTRRGNFVFLTCSGDHATRHVHVYKNGRLVVKWDLDNWLPMKGKATRHVLDLIRELEEEGRL